MHQAVLLPRLIRFQWVILLYHWIKHSTLYTNLVGVSTNQVHNKRLDVCLNAAELRPALYITMRGVYIRHTPCVAPRGLVHCDTPLSNLKEVEQASAELVTHHTHFLSMFRVWSCSYGLCSPPKVFLPPHTENRHDYGEPAGHSFPEYKNEYLDGAESITSAKRHLIFSICKCHRCPIVFVKEAQTKPN